MTITVEWIGAVAALITAIAGTGVLTYRLTIRKLRAETSRIETQNAIERDSLNDTIIDRVRGIMELERAHFEREIVELQADIAQMRKLRESDRRRIKHLESTLRIALDYIKLLHGQLITNNITPKPLPDDLLDWHSDERGDDID